MFVLGVSVIDQRCLRIRFARFLSKWPRNFMSVYSFLISTSSKKFVRQNSGEIGHSLANDLLDEFGVDEDAKDAHATLYLGETEVRF